MPSNLVVRGGGVGARVTVSGRQRWLGTFATPELAEAAIARARRRRARPAPRRVAPPGVAAVDAIATQAPALEGFIRVAAWSGLRLFEVAALDARDVRIDGDRALLRVRHGKGDRPRESVCLEPAVDWLRDLPGGLVFANAAGGAWTRQAVHRHFKRARARAGVPGVWFHDLRKFHATWLLDHGASDLDVAVQLGHFDAEGRPNPELVRRIYGFPDHGAALDRISRLGGGGSWVA